jgi:uncharacterized cupin superfamily protein
MGSKFGAATKQFGLATGARSIGCSWYEVSPGKAAFPHHFHCAKEESLFVLEGEGRMRVGKETVTVRSGDYVTFAIGPESAPNCAIPAAVHCVIFASRRFTPLKLLVTRIRKK